jgi:ribulose-phosphate 3-epimerase
MTVHPGFGGQAFRSAVVPKVRSAARYKRLRGLDFAIEVDGGISVDTVAEVVDAGAEIVVAGSAIFGDGDPAANVQALREAAARALARPG